ncbi:MAG: SdpI family protein [Balneolaceae bacterium]|nr:SdpI family protein [Balneolaceae bacterium]
MKLLATLKKEWYILLLLLLPYVLIPFIGGQVPDQVPTHWNIQGQADGFSDKSFVLWWFPLFAIVTYLLILVVPLIDPKKRISIDQKPLPALRLLLPLFFLGMYTVMIMPTFKPGWDQSFMVFLLVTLLFLIFGNYLRTLKPNYFIGLRTPWTLEDPDNWRKTHELGSKLWIGTSLLLLVVAFFVPAAVYSKLFFAGVMVMAIVPLAYSFWLFKSQPEN